MDYLKGFGLDPKSGEKPLEVFKEGSDATRLAFCKVCLGRSHFGAETKQGDKASSDIVRQEMTEA